MSFKYQSKLITLASYNSQVDTVQVVLSKWFTVLSALVPTCYIPHLILITVFDDLCAQVAAGNCSQVLLVALAVTRIFVQHVWRSSLDL